LQPYRDALAGLRAGHTDFGLPSSGQSVEAALLQSALEFAREQTRARREAQQVLHIADLAVEGLSLEETLEHIFTGFRDSIPFDRLGCALLTDDGSRAVARWAKPMSTETVIKQGFSSSMAGSSLRQILQTGKPRIINDLEEYLGEHPESVTTRLVLEEGIRSSLTCPLIAQGKHLGFLFFSSWQKFNYQSMHQEIFIRIATQISCLIERSRLHDRLESLNQRLIQAQGELERQATHDALTGIYNRRAILRTLHAQLGRLGLAGEHCGAIMIDVDHFKRINDQHGHQAGDAVLQGIAATLARHLRAEDTVGRYGGEEFLIVVGAARPETVLALAERLRRAIEEVPIVVNGAQHAVTISVGAGLAIPGNFPDTARLIQCADRALYQAKANGRNRVCHCTTE
jgi:diguanylate cyclase (GGDEF)-like protein